MIRLARRAVVTLVSVAGFFCARVAVADDGPRVGWDRSACTTLPYDVTSFEKLLAIELRDAHVVLDPGATDRLTVAPPTCRDGETTVDVVVRAEGASGETRHVDLAGVPPEARPRTLALVASELVVETLTRPVVTRPAPTATAPAGTTLLVAPPPNPSWAPPGGSHASPVMRGFVAGLSFAHRAFPVDDTALAGLELRASIRVVGPLRIRTAILGLYDRADSDLGRVHLVAGSGAIGVSAGMRGDLIGFDVGPRLDVGAVLAEGHAASASVVAADPDPAGAAVTLGIDAELQLYVTRGFLATIGLEGGAALVGLEAKAGERVLAGTSGPFVGLRVGVAIAP